MEPIFMMEPEAHRHRGKPEPEKTREQVEDELLISQGQRHFSSGNELCQSVRKIGGPTVFLSFSCGKDSIGAYLALREHFEEIILFHQYKWYPIPQFVLDSIKYYEDLWQTKIWMLPYAKLYQFIYECLFQPPHRRRIIFEIDFPTRLRRDEDYIVQQLKDYLGHPRAYTAQGIRAFDNLARRASVKNHGAVNHKRKTFWPIFDYTKKQLLDSIENAGVKLPVDYRLYNRSFEALNYQFVKPIQEHFPEDYERLKEMYPLLDAEIHRARYAHARRDIHE